DFHVTGVQTCALPIYVEGNAGRAERLDLLACPAEDKGIARLQPNDAPPRLRLADEDGVDLALARGMRTFRLADEDALGVPPRLEIGRASGREGGWRRG